MISTPKSNSSQFTAVDSPDPLLHEDPPESRRTSFLSRTWNYVTTPLQVVYSFVTGSPKPNIATVSTSVQTFDDQDELMAGPTSATPARSPPNTPYSTTSNFFSQNLLNGSPVSSAPSTPSTSVLQSSNKRKARNALSVLSRKQEGNPPISKSRRLGSVVQKRKQLMAHSTTQISNDMQNRVFISTCRNGSRTRLEDGESLVRMMMETEQLTMKSNRDEMEKRRAAGRYREETPSYRDGTSYDDTRIRPATFKAAHRSSVLPEAEVPIHTDWMANLRAKIAAYLETKPETLEAVAAPVTAIFDELIEEDRRVMNLIHMANEEREQAKLPALAAIPSHEDLFPPLSEEDFQRIEACWVGPDLKVVITAHNVEMKVKDFRTLRGSSWLNDEVINMYGQICMARAKAHPDKYPKIHVFNTFFYHKLSGKDGYGGVRRWTKKIDVFALDYVIFPVHLGNHWCCAVINFKLKRFEYYDSLHGTNLRCLSAMRTYLEAEHQDKKKSPWQGEGWTEWAPKDRRCPAQENGYDCGVFSCLAMEFTARDMEFLYGQRDIPYMRERMIKEILDQRLMWY